MKKLKHYIKCSSIIELLTGMHIGGSKEALKIGGIDNPVIRNPVTNMPYIPGSSLKGRLRMALELKHGETTIEPKGVGPSQNQDSDSLICKLFGNGSPKNTSEPTRLIIRDANLVSGYEEFAQGEEKIEVKIDREKLSAFQGGNRIQERIAAGAKFNFEIMIRIFEDDLEDKFKNKIKEAIKIVELEFLGGSGSRGYGQVKFEELKFEKIDI
ncbi:MAG: type III-A CRISPR-associated RAMP protein Csm3 [Bacteroidetes bacterium]|nr:type III-A CRISPR-associated RAMP protein Csm3 [Bacteroidota bacterium]